MIKEQKNPMTLITTKPPSPQRKTRQNLMTVFFTAMLGLLTTSAYADRDCEDYGNGTDGWDGFGTQAEECIWFYNDTKDAILIHRWDNYDDSEDADYGDDYKAFYPLQKATDAGDTLYLPPGRFTPVAWIDDNGWSPMWYDSAPDVEWRTLLEINGQEFHSGYIKAAIAFGQVTNYEFRLTGSDGWRDSQGYKDVTLNGKKYRIYGADSGLNGDHYDTDRVFTIRELDSNGNEFGNMGYLPPDTSNNANKVNVMNFNTYLLDVLKPHVADRAEATAKAKHRLFENVDILVLNEIGHVSNSWDGVDLVNDLCCDANDPFRDKTDYVDQAPTNQLPGTSGGVIILSKYPNSLSDEYQREFNNCNGDDCLMPKGYMRAKFTKPGTNGSKEYHLVATHMQADGGTSRRNVRQKQFAQMKSAGEASTTEGTPVIYVGDFNVEEYDGGVSEYDDMMSALNADAFFDQKTGPLRWSDDWESNFWPNGASEGGPVEEGYDFILHSRARPQPTTATWRYVPLLSDKNFMPSGAAEHLSDHHAVVAELDYTNRESDWSDKLGALFNFTDNSSTDVSDEKYFGYKRQATDSYFPPLPTTDRFNNENSATFFNGLNNYVRVYDTASDSNFDTFSYTDGTDPKAYHHAAVNFKPVGHNITIGAWVCPQDWTPANDQIVMSTNGSYSGGKNSTGYRLFIQPDGKWRVDFGNGSTRRYLRRTHGFVDGECHHLAATYDGDYIRLYEDGVRVSSYNIPSSADYFKIHYNNNPLTIGANSSDPNHEPTTGFFSGRIDEVFVVGKAMSSDEIYDAVNMAGHWKLQGGDAKDSSLQNQDGIVNGAVPTTDHNGNEDRALLFDGQNDYVLIDHDYSGLAPYQRSANAMTLATWACNDDWSRADNQILISNQQSGGFRLFVNSSGGLRANFWTSTGNYRYTWRTGLTNGQCHHLAATYSGDQIKLYVDGQLHKTSNYSSVKPIVFNQNLGLVLGAEPTSSSNPNAVDDHFKGKMYDTRIYNKLLDEVDINDLYNETR